MKLYDSRMAPNPRRVRIFLAEKGIEVPTEQVDMMAKQHLTPEYTAINPLQRMPALALDDGTIISESIAICRYFEALRPQPPLFGTGAREIAIVEMWNRRCELNLLFPVAQVFRHSHPAMKELEVPQVPAWALKGVLGGDSKSQPSDPGGSPPRTARNDTHKSVESVSRAGGLRHAAQPATNGWRWLALLATV